MNVNIDGCFTNYRLPTKGEGVRKNNPSKEGVTYMKNPPGGITTAGDLEGSMGWGPIHPSEPWEGPIGWGPIHPSEPYPFGPSKPWVEPTRPEFKPFPSRPDSPSQGPTSDEPSKGGFWDWLTGNSADNDVDKNPEVDNGTEVDKGADVDVDTLSLTEQEQKKIRDILLIKRQGLDDLSLSPRVTM